MPHNLSIGLSLSPRDGANPNSYAPNPPPVGWHWEFVTYQNRIVTYQNQPIVALTRN